MRPSELADLAAVEAQDVGQAAGQLQRGDAASAFVAHDGGPIDSEFLGELSLREAELPSSGSDVEGAGTGEPALQTTGQDPLGHGLALGQRDGGEAVEGDLNKEF